MFFEACHLKSYGALRCAKEVKFCKALKIVLGIYSEYYICVLVRSSLLVKRQAGREVPHGQPPSQETPCCTGLYRTRESQLEASLGKALVNFHGSFHSGIILQRKKFHNTDA